VSELAAQAYKVSKVDNYLVCPFRYFAASVLRLPEERDEESGLTPLERGMVLHRLFERFYTEWQAAGRGAITADALPEAAELFERLTHDELSTLPEAERALETARLLGSIVGRGVAERVFEREVDAEEPVARRLLEQKLNGTYDFPAIGGARAVEIKGTADRIDVLADGALRLVDYKLTKLPELETAMQLAVYAYCAQRHLEAEDGQSHPVRAAMYLAFGSDRQFELSLAKKGDLSVAVDAAALQFAQVVTHIEAGEFPVKPRDTRTCTWCRFSGVCRKEYEGDGETAEPV
jgi:RecB family exonuclease